MKKIILLFTLITILGVSCKKGNNTDIIDQKQDLYESNLVFINSDWTFDITGDSLKDQIIGLWLSNEVSYDDTLCSECDSLFTWVIESTGVMVKRNNDWGDHETMYGDWDIDSIEKIILFSYKLYPSAGNEENSDNYKIVTDSIKIEDLTKANLWVSQFLDYPPTKTFGIKFEKLK